MRPQKENSKTGKNRPRSVLGNLLVLLDGQRLEPIRQRLDRGLGPGHRCRRYRRAGSTGGEGCQGKEEGQGFHGAGVRGKVWRYRGGR